MRELAERQGEVVEEVLASLGNFNDLDASNVLSFVLMGEGFGAAEASSASSSSTTDAAEAADALG